MIWIVGFLIELGADTHKFIFNQNPNNKDKFISSGLWKYSRHPNYCGEIILWSGLAVFLVRSFTGWEYLSLISPVFVYFLLTKLSGVPLLEDKADKKWGNSP
jgi:steroid 5-alpha reductase family enzyme